MRILIVGEIYMSDWYLHLDKRKYSFWGKGLTICSFFTVLSQLPQIVDMGISSLISKIVWVVFFVLIVSTTKGKASINIQKIMFSIAMMFSYMLFTIIASIITNKQYYATSLFNSVFLSIFIFFIGAYIGKQITKYDCQMCAIAYLIASTILALDLYFTIYRGADISNVVYLYASKNSAGVIVFTAALIAFVYSWKIRSTFLKISNIAIMAFLIYLVFVMKTRAMIVCIPVVIAIAVIRAPFKKRIKVPIVILCIGLIVLLQNETMYDMLINDIVLGGRTGDLNSVSSGRFEQWLELADNMSGNLLIGDGTTEQESLILTALIQCGLIMGGLIIAYAMWPLIYSIYKVRNNKSYEMFLLLLVSVTYFIDAIFEQLAPFGPGARCFYLWLMFGILLVKNNKGEIIDERKKYKGID